MTVPGEPHELVGLARSIRALFTDSAEESTADASIHEHETPRESDPLPETEPVAQVVSEADPVPPPLPEHEPTAPEAELVPPPLPETEPTPPPLPVADATEPVDGDTTRGSYMDPSEEGAAPSISVPLDEEYEPTALDEAVDAFLSGDRSFARDIEERSADALEAREIQPVVRSLVRIALDAGEPPEPEVFAAARPMVIPLVLARLAKQMGDERSEPRRQEYFTVCRAIGADMARAIRDDLAETTDRHARRVHCDALVAMGPVGRAVIEEMVVDENRFLVRNAVAILGDVGGDRALELVRPELANPDARIRREALRALVKLGDAESADLIVSRLDDDDEEVALGAAVASGELGLSRAVKQVVAMLEGTKDPDRAIRLLRALGQLEDPGAVPAIEKHAVPSLFSKPRTDVRIQAYRALNHIGTPKARKLLNRAVEDKNLEVRAAVREMLNMA